MARAGRGTWLALLVTLLAGICACDTQDAPGVNDPNRGEEGVDNRYFLLFADRGWLIPYEPGVVTESGVAAQAPAPVLAYLILEDVRDGVLWYADRPERDSGEIASEAFFRQVWPAAFGDVSPNAVSDCSVLEAQAARGEETHDGIFFNLTDPLYYSDTRELSFSIVTVLNWTLDERPESPRTLTDIKITLLPNSAVSAQRWSFGQVAASALFEPSGSGNGHLLHLGQIYEGMYYVSHAPAGEASEFPVESFLDGWEERFGQDPPNASLTAYSLAFDPDLLIPVGVDLKVFLLTLSNPVLSGPEAADGDLTYTAQQMQGGDPIEEDEVLLGPTLFIDDGGAPSHVRTCTLDEPCRGCNVNQYCCPKTNPGGCVDKSHWQNCKFTTCGCNWKDWCRNLPDKKQPHRITFVNNCREPVWVAGINGKNGPPNPMNAGGWNWELGPKGSATHTRAVKVPYGWDSGRFWPRTGCKYVGSPAQKHLECDTGTCYAANDGPAQLNCTESGDPATVVEFTLDGGKPNPGAEDNYDVSYVDGWNVPATIKPELSQDYGHSTWCGTCGCDSVPACPWAERTGACFSPCKELTKLSPSAADLYKVCCKCNMTSDCTCNQTCCANRCGCSPYGQAGTNPKDQWCDPKGDLGNPACKWGKNPKTGKPWADYIDLVSRTCPYVYAWQYHDPKGLFKCKKTDGTAINYTVTFCP